MFSTDHEMLSTEKLHLSEIITDKNENVKVSNFMIICKRHPYLSAGCVHYGVIYKQGETWQDGCKYDCECIDYHTGRYECKERFVC